MLSEKNRKDKWMHDKEREIRDQAMKSFEPELERLMDGHRHDMEKIQRDHFNHIEQVKAKLREEFEEHMKKEKERIKIEIDEEVLKEREGLHEKFKLKFEEIEK